MSLLLCRSISALDLLSGKVELEVLNDYDEHAIVALAASIVEWAKEVIQPIPEEFCVRFMQFFNHKAVRPPFVYMAARELYHLSGKKTSDVMRQLTRTVRRKHRKVAEQFTKRLGHALQYEGGMHQISWRTGEVTYVRKQKDVHRPRSIF